MEFKNYKYEIVCKTNSWYVCFGIKTQRLLFINTWKHGTFKNKIDFENADKKMPKWNKRATITFNIV